MSKAKDLHGNGHPSEVKKDNAHGIVPLSSRGLGNLLGMNIQTRSTTRMHALPSQQDTVFNVLGSELNSISIDSSPD